jgi:hypothetical protein
MKCWIFTTRTCKCSRKLFINSLYWNQKLQLISDGKNWSWFYGLARLATRPRLRLDMQNQDQNNTNVAKCKILAFLPPPKNALVYLKLIK